jgi:hypothetical protein
MGNQLGKSIIKAAFILSAAILITVIIYSATRPRYTPLNMNGCFIDEWTGYVYSASGRQITDEKNLR